MLRLLYPFKAVSTDQKFYAPSNLLQSLLWHYMLHANRLHSFGEFAPWKRRALHAIHDVVSTDSRRLFVWSLFVFTKKLLFSNSSARKLIKQKNNVLQFCYSFHPVSASSSGEIGTSRRRCAWNPPWKMALCQMSEFLLFLHVPPPKTFFESLRHLPSCPSTCLSRSGRCWAEASPTSEMRRRCSRTLTHCRSICILGDFLRG